MTITLEKDEYGSGRERWAVRNSAGDLLGYRVERSRAVRLAESVKPTAEAEHLPLPAHMIDRGR